MKEDSLASCRAGIARTALRCGDVRKGLAVAREVGSRAVTRAAVTAVNKRVLHAHCTVKSNT